MHHAPLVSSPKIIMEEQRMSYEEYVVDQRYTVDEVRKNFPQASTVPIIVIDENIWRISELSEFLEKAA